jgi:hypothetical protein
MTALQFLSTHLREHHHHEDIPGDFDKLCLVLVGAASSSHASQLPDRAQSIANILEAIDHELQSCDDPLIENAAPPQRLLSLLDRAVLFQCGQFPPVVPTTTLLSDFRPSVLSSRDCTALCAVNSVNSVKALAFVDGGTTLLAGSGTVSGSGLRHLVSIAEILLDTVRESGQLQLQDKRLRREVQMGQFDCGLLLIGHQLGF